VVSAARALRRRLAPGLDAPQRVWLLSTTLIVGALAIWLLGLRDLAPMSDAVQLHWWALAPMFLLAETFVIHLDVRRQAHTVSLAEVPLVLGLFFATPGELLVGQAVGAAVALIAYRRQPWIKAIFNLGQFAIVTCAAIVVFRALCPVSDDIGPAQWGATIVAVVVADLIAGALVTGVIALVEGGLALPYLGQLFGVGTVIAIANAGLGLLGVELLQAEPAAALLLIVPVVVSGLAYRGFWRERRRSEHLAFLYESMRGLNASPDIERAVLQLLGEARGMFRAEVAGLTLVMEDGGPPRRTILGPEERVELMEPIAALPATPDEPVLASARRARAPRDCPALGREVRDAMMTTLHGEAGIVGTMVVADRASDVNTFTTTDLEVFETYATHAGVALENRNLQRSLQRLARENSELAQQALLDPLTSLPNRRLLLDRAGDALARPGTDGELVSVLFVDLDDFKTINDTRGHAVGDQVLVAVAERLRACLRPGDTAARLGGDEFAILLDHLRVVGDAEAVCERVLEGLRAPVSADGGPLEVRASIGLAVAAAGECTAEDLVSDADSAMYAAKSLGKGRWIVFTHEAEAGRLGRRWDRRQGTPTRP
jgi:diguanylate cyclase (GGDEF)-like protein